MQQQAAENPHLSAACQYCSLLPSVCAEQSCNSNQSCWPLPPPPAHAHTLLSFSHFLLPQTKRPTWQSNINVHLQFQWKEDRGTIHVKSKLCSWILCWVALYGNELSYRWFKSQNMPTSNYFWPTTQHYFNNRLHFILYVRLKVENGTVTIETPPQDKNGYPCWEWLTDVCFTDVCILENVVHAISGKLQPEGNRKSDFFQTFLTYLVKSIQEERCKHVNVIVWF